jgi:magnesium transporter
VYSLSFLTDTERTDILHDLYTDELTDLFDLLSDEELKKYLSLLHKSDREKVLSLLKFDPESAGGIMDTDVLTLIEDFTVEKSVKLLQRLQPRLEIHREIYVTDRTNHLVGHIHLEDLVLRHPQARIESFLKKNELIASAYEDREEVVKKMVHYDLTTVPVVGDNDYFLGVIPSSTLVDVIEQEAGEDVYRISALTPIKQTYFETPFFKLMYQRSYILITLLIVESFSSTILKAYEVTLCGFLMYFIPMLVSTGGNTSSQTSALVIQGLATGEIYESNMKKFLWREFFMAAALALILGIAAFGRVYFSLGKAFESFAVSLSLSLIVLVSVLLGSFFPLILKRLNIDPAFSAGPFLATLMDILGILIYCFISKALLF